MNIDETKPNLSTYYQHIVIKEATSVRTFTLYLPPCFHPSKIHEIVEKNNKAVLEIP